MAIRPHPWASKTVIKRQQDWMNHSKRLPSRLFLARFRRCCLISRLGPPTEMRIRNIRGYLGAVMTMSVIPMSRDTACPRQVSCRKDLHPIVSCRFSTRRVRSGQPSGHLLEGQIFYSVFMERGRIRQLCQYTIHRNSLPGTYLTCPFSIHHHPYIHIRYLGEWPTTATILFAPLDHHTSLDYHHISEMLTDLSVRCPSLS
ncbi:hypothetical protein B0H66DRAFT_83836 [Apodospora peruviana]|uniref:Uncharacterized protein n=1 Tax=Apodospora peruviana TaxID=516989 RepID=A0AAE0ITP6_9PEZI|nr:hypothetical protein B0H66DRAFT_83836 [Apodospora peruviana]